MKRLPRTLLLVALAAFLGGCAQTGYYVQALRGHLDLVQAARPVGDWLTDARTSEALRARLQLALRIRAFAVESLALPDNASFHRYADLQRRAVVWNVVAAPPYALQARTWCFMVVGCVGYRGYFDEAGAHALARQLRDDGLEVDVHGVPAYSTLGWTNWLGGDPLLSTFLGWPPGDLARLMFHELAHQVVYARDDTVFNESFATAVERLGVRQWLQAQGSERIRADDAVAESRREAFRALVRETRGRLEQIYGAPAGPSGVDRPQLRAAKEAVMADFRARYAQQRVQWPLHAGYDDWVARANNASFVAFGAYDALVPAFEALYRRTGGDWRRFYDAVRRLAALPTAQRHRQLLDGAITKEADDGG